MNSSRATADASAGRVDRDEAGFTRVLLLAGRVTRRFALDAVVFAVILLLGLVRLPEPFFGDQALNSLMGQLIATGGRPYADLWDLKHPGIFFFFATGGALFGFHEVGIHLFELLWMLLLALAVRLIAGTYLKCRPVASLAPALTVGVYYAGTTGYHLTQTEAVIGLPLLLSLVTVAVAARPTCAHPFPWLFASGLCAGVAAVFKAPYVVVPGLFWLLAGLQWQSVRQGRLARIRKMAPPIVIGLLVPMTATIIFLSAKPGLGLAWWTFVVHPREAAVHGAANLERFTDGLVWFARTFRVPLVLAVVGVWDRLRRGWDLLTRSLVAWVAAAALVISIQVISWWPYHYLSLFVPVGLLAAQGVETLWFSATAARGPSRRRAVAFAALLVLCVLYLRQVRPIPSAAAAVFRARPLPFDQRSMQAFNAARDRFYADALSTTAFLREPGSHPGPIYVFADPNLYLLARRAPAIPLITWGTSPPAGSWDRLMSALDQRAPAYVFVDDGFLEVLVLFTPSLQPDIAVLRRRLSRRYRELRTDPSGTWYVRGDLIAGRAGT